MSFVSIVVADAAVQSQTQPMTDEMIDFARSPTTKVMTIVAELWYHCHTMLMTMIEPEVIFKKETNNSNELGHLW